VPPKVKTASMDDKTASLFYQPMTQFDKTKPILYLYSRKNVHPSIISLFFLELSDLFFIFAAKEQKSR
jgi:hypothetical protein